MVVEPAFNPELHPDNQLGIYPEKYPPASSSDEGEDDDGDESDESCVDNATTLVLGDDIAPLADVPSDHEPEGAGEDAENLVTPPKRAATDDAVAARLIGSVTSKLFLFFPTSKKHTKV